MTVENPLRRLPAVHAILDHAELAGLDAVFGRDEILRSVRLVLAEARTAILAGEVALPDAASLARRAAVIAGAETRHLRPVINATGILLNTGLGRAPLASTALAEVEQISRGYSNLEFDLESGLRGDRTTGVEALLRDLTGAEAAAVVNNNAAATVLALRAMARGREVVVSRGQLVEIGGSFRLPEIFEVSGARLREVGTTNRTRLDDYVRAIGPETAALLRVHPSNYRVVGFTESVGIAALAALASDRGIACLDDVGSGLLRRDLIPGLADEPAVADSITAGADLVLFSGDKLLGGPQSGLLVGRRAAIERIKADPLMRALRVDKMTLAALEATLRLARRASSLTSSIPLWDLLRTPIDALQARAQTIADRLSAAGFLATVEPAEALLGGGSDPDRPIASRAVRLTPPYPGLAAPLDEAGLARALRVGPQSIVPRVQGGSVLIDWKAVLPDQDERIAVALLALARSD